MKPLTRQNATDGHTGDVMAAALARAETMCHAVAGRDLGETPLCIVLQSELPEGFGSGDPCYGYTTPSLDLYLKEHIRDWRGRGPCMVINDLALPVICAGYQYRLSHAARYQEALGDEPQRCVNPPIREIQASPAPRPFVDLWLEDIGD